MPSKQIKKWFFRVVFIVWVLCLLWLMFVFLLVVNKVQPTL